MQGKASTIEVADEIGIDRTTLQRWISAGKIGAPELTIRDGRAVRLWSRSQIETLRKAAERLYHQGGGRKKKGSK